LRGHRARVRGGLPGAVPGRRGVPGPHRPERHAHHRYRGGGPPARQEDQAAVVAVRRRTVADRRRAAGGDLPGAAQPVLRHGRGGGGARRREPGPAADAPQATARAQPADRHHPPEADHGDRRRAVRRDHAQRGHRGDQPATEHRGRRGGRGMTRREPARALLVDLDGVLRRWDATVTAAVEERYGVAPGTVLETLFEWPRLVAATTGQISDAEWHAQTARALADRLGGDAATARSLVDEW